MKRLTQTLAFCLLTAFTAVAQKNYVSEVWVSALGNGKYKNPVLYADCLLYTSESQVVNREQFPLLKLRIEN